MWAKLVLITNIDYSENVEALKEFENKYSSLSEIPKTFYKNLDDEEIVEHFEDEKDDDYLELKYKDYLRIKEEETANETYNGRYDSVIAELKALMDNDIAAYYNSMPEYIVEDGKVYTVINLIDGKFDFLGELEDFEPLKNKNGDAVEFGILEEIEHDSITADASLLINATTGYSTECGFNDDAEEWDKEALEYIKSLDQKLYVFAFGYHF